MDKRASIASELAALDPLCPAGFAIALHIKFTAPTFLFQTYPARWREIYTEKGLVLHDPTVKWGMKHTGLVNWRDLVDEDEANVLRMAREYGLLYGFTLAIVVDGSRSLASFARTDRDFLDVEIDRIRDHLTALHDETAGLEDLSREDRDALRRMSVHLTHGNS